MAATKFGPDYDEGLDVRGVVVLDGTTTHNLDVEIAMAGRADPSLLMFGILGYTRAYPELRLDDVLRPDAVADMDFWDTTGCNVDPPWDGTAAAAVIHTSPLEVQSWVDRIEEGSAREPSYPVFYPVADAEPYLDERVAYGVGVGAEVVHYPLPIDHYTIIQAAADDVLRWMAERSAD